MDPTLADRARGKERTFVSPPVNGDFYQITDLLDQKERAVVERVHDFMEAAVAPIIGSKSGPAFGALISGALTAMRSSIMGSAFPLLRRARKPPAVLRSGPSGPTSRRNMFESLETQPQISPEGAHPEWRLRGG